MTICLTCKLARELCQCPVHRVLQPSDCCAVVVTRDAEQALDVYRHLKYLNFGRIIFWDNKRQRDYKVFGRYAAMLGVPGPIFTCDDDCLVDAEAVCAAYEPGIIVANSDPHHRAVNAPFYRHGIAPIGWGAIFDVNLISVLEGWEHDELFLRECDRVFTALNTVKLIEVPFRHLERASAPDRMWREKRHLSDLSEITERILRVKAAKAA